MRSRVGGGSICSKSRENHKVIPHPWWPAKGRGKGGWYEKCCEAQQTRVDNCRAWGEAHRAAVCPGHYCNGCYKRKQQVARPLHKFDFCFI